MHSRLGTLLMLILSTQAFSKTEEVSLRSPSEILDIMNKSKINYTYEVDDKLDFGQLLKSPPEPQFRIPWVDLKDGEGFLTQF